MTVNRFARHGMLLAALALVMCGCAKQENSNLVPVTGTVKLDGKPLAGASLTFTATGETQGMGGIGVADEAGNFEVSHFRAGKGLEPGKYKITVSKLVMSDGSPIPEEAESAVELNTRNLVPAQYSDSANTILEADIQKGGSPVTLDLKSK